jgi:hypothetical protein
MMDMLGAATLLLAAAAESGGGEKWTKFVPLVAVIVLVIGLMMRRSARTATAYTAGMGRRETTASSSQQPLRGDAERLLVELQEFGREIEGRLETRIHHLTRLLAEADKAIERLTALAASAHEPAPADGPREREPVRKQIVELAGRGMEAAEIARTLGIPKGEVEVVLGIERKFAD